MNDFSYLQVLHNLITVIHLAAWTTGALATWKLRCILKSPWANVAFVSFIVVLACMLPLATLFSLGNLLPGPIYHFLFNIPYLIHTISAVATLSMLTGMTGIAGLIATRFAGQIPKHTPNTP